MTLDLAMIFWSAIKSTSNKRPNRWIGLPQQDKLLCIKGARKKIIHHPKWHNMFVIMYLMTSVAHPPSPRRPRGVPVGSLPSQVIRGFQAPQDLWAGHWSSTAPSRRECWMVLSPGSFSSLPSKTGGFSSLQKNTESLGVFENQENFPHFPEKYILLHLQTSEISDALCWWTVGEDTFCESMIRSQCLVSLCFWTVNWTVNFTSIS